MTIQLDIGSRSHGTLRDQDIAAAMLDDLRAIGFSPANLSAIEAIANGTESGEFDAEYLADAMDELNAFVPPFCYYGLHQGDASDLGVWPDFDAIDDAVHSGEVIKVSDLSEITRENASECEFALVVNDHGNATLYPVTVGTGESVWAVV